MSISPIVGSPIDLKPYQGLTSTAAKNIVANEKLQNFDGKVVATAEKLPEGTKVETLPTPAGGIPSLSGTKSKPDVISLSPEAQAYLSKKSLSDKATEGQAVEGKPIIAPAPVAPAPRKISPQIQRIVDMFIGRIRSVTSQFDGLPQTPENLDKLSTALKEAGISADQLRIYPPRAVNPPVNEQGLTVYQQLMNAYTPRWKA